MNILLVEDETHLSEAMEVMLKHYNYEVDIASDGEKAEDFLQNKNYDIIIMDIMIPKKDGITLLNELRENKIFTPVIMVTAKDMVEDKIFTLDHGANDYLTKPFDFKELLARIRVLTRNNENVIIKHGDLILNSSTLELKNKNGCYCLANKEFQVLEFLITNKKEKVTTKKIIDKVWTNTTYELSIVQVYINYLQKKLNLLNSTVKIQGNNSEGYYLINKG